MAQPGPGPTRNPDMPPLHRFSVGDSVSQTLRLSLRFFPAFFLIMLVLHSPAKIATYVFFDELVQVELQSSEFASFGVSEPVAPIYETLSWGIDAWEYIAGLLAAGIFSHIVIRHLHHKRSSFGETVRVALTRFFPLLVAALFAGLLISGSVFSIALLGTFIHWSVALVCAPVVVILFVASSVTPAAVVVEKAGPIAAIRRSFALTRRHRLPVFGCWITVLFLMLLLSIPCGAILGFTIGIEGRAGALALGLFSQGVLIPVWVCPVVIYHGLLVAKEGASAQQLVSVFE